VAIGTAIIRSIGYVRRFSIEISPGTHSLLSLDACCWNNANVFFFFFFVCVCVCVYRPNAGMVCGVCKTMKNEELGCSGRRFSGGLSACVTYKHAHAGSVHGIQTTSVVQGIHL